MKELVKKLTEAYGPSGFEGQVRALITAEVQGVADEVRTDGMGNLFVLKKGRDSRHRALVAAHMDEIGVMVTHIDKDGFARFTRIGGVRPLGLPGARVVFASGITGGIGLEKLEDRTKIPDMDKMFIDVGAKDKESCPVKVGDAATFWQPFVAQHGRWIAKAFDDRIGCAVLVEALRTMPKPAYDTYFVFTAQEEVGVRGATVAAFGVEPDYAIAVDVTTTGDTPESHPMAVGLGKGPAIKVMDRGMIVHQGLKNWMIRTAEEVGAPYQLEVLEFGSTDAMAMQTTKEGIPAGVLSIPTRYVHSPSEMVDEGDVQNSVTLLAALLSRPVSLE
ncbi:MAG: M42 family metallopeptidase [Chloroflexi bacterium]|nr:M42 family metallopeptidase [Chloroflexota bacterium]